MRGFVLLYMLPLAWAAEAFQSIFGLGHHLNIPYVCLTMILLVVFTILFEHLVEKVNDVLASHKEHLKLMFKKTMFELSILGLISFSVVVLEQSGTF